MADYRILQGDALTVLRTLEAESVNCCVTSPPYWGLRSYSTAPQIWGRSTECEHEWTGPFCGLCDAWRGELGLEPTPDLFVEHVCQVFREVRRVLRNDGTAWVNLGDSYATGAGKVGECPGGGEQGERWKGNRGTRAADPQSTRKDRWAQ